MEAPSHAILMTNLEQTFSLRDSLFCRIKGNLLSSFFSCVFEACLVPQETDSEKVSLDRVLDLGRHGRVAPIGVKY